MYSDDPPLLIEASFSTVAKLFSLVRSGVSIHFSAYDVSQICLRQNLRQTAHQRNDAFHGSLMAAASAASCSPSCGCTSPIVAFFAYRPSSETFIAPA